METTVPVSWNENDDSQAFLHALYKYEASVIVSIFTTSTKVFFARKPALCDHHLQNKFMFNRVKEDEDFMVLLSNSTSF